MPLVTVHRSNAWVSCMGTMQFLLWRTWPAKVSNLWPNGNKFSCYAIMNCTQINTIQLKIVHNVHYVWEEAYPFMEKMCLKCILVLMMVARAYLSMAESSQCRIIHPLITFRNKHKSWLQLNELVIRENILSINCNSKDSGPYTVTALCFHPSWAKISHLEIILSNLWN